MDHDKRRRHHLIRGVRRSIRREIDTDRHVLRGLDREADALRQFLHAQRITSIDEPRRDVEAASSAVGKCPHRDGRRTGSTADGLRRTVRVVGLAAAPGRVPGTASRLNADLDLAAPAEMRDAWPVRFGGPRNNAVRHRLATCAPCSRDPGGLRVGWREHGRAAPLDRRHFFGFTGPSVGRAAP